MASLLPTRESINPSSSNSPASSPNWLDYKSLPSSCAESYKSTSPEPRDQERGGTEHTLEDEVQPKGWWNAVKKSVVEGALVAVGLKPTQNESRHWDIVKGFVLGEVIPQDEVDGDGDEVGNRSVVFIPSHHQRDRSIVRQATYSEFDTLPPSTATVVGDGGGVGVGGKKEPFLMRQLSKHCMNQSASVMSYKVEKTVQKKQQPLYTELKPDLWKVAMNSVRNRTKMSDEEKLLGKRKKRSASIPEATIALSTMADTTPSSVLTPTITVGTTSLGEDEVDSAPIARSPGLLPYATVQPDNIGRATPTQESPVAAVDDKKRTWYAGVSDFFSGGYTKGYGGLGPFTKLLQFKYKKLDKKRSESLDSQFLHKRPYFTYWLMLVHVLVMVVALAVYGFAPYGWDLIEERNIVRQTDLSLAIVNKRVVGSIWGGPPQQALVLLGATFAPCMRRDRQIYEGIDADRSKESTSSGCCVRRDQSGCFQARNSSFCQMRFSEFFTKVNDTRAVCGTSPNTCLEPSRTFSPGIWLPHDVQTWPVCFRRHNSTQEHLSCEITSRPCCYGIQAICIITTREQCTFLNGRFHQEAFLCSQVDCLNDICGLLPFNKFNQPDQIYRLWLAIFLHAGLIHLVLSLLFSFFILRHVEKRLGWLRTSIIYIWSGIGGNLVSAYFAPYNPEVGPAGSILGVVAYFFVFLMFESRLLVKWWVEALKLVGVCLFLFVLGLVPYIDNFAHFGGFVFGFLISGILVPYGPYKQAAILIKKNPKKDDDEYDYFLYLKVFLIIAGIIGSLLLAVLFFILFYVVQTTWQYLSFLTCVPLTRTLCIDQQVLIRDRDEPII